MANRQQVQEQLAKLDLVFEPKKPRAINGQPNPRFAAYQEVFIEALLPFSLDELQRGIKDALEQHKYNIRPTPAELRDYCLAHHKREQTHNRKSLDDLRAEARRLPPPEYIPPEERRQNADRFARIQHALKHGHADGTPYGKDEAKDRAWVYQGIPAGQRKTA